MKVWKKIVWSCLEKVKSLSWESLLVKMLQQNNMGRSYVSGRKLSSEIQNNFQSLYVKGYDISKISSIERIHYNTTKKYLMNNNKITKPQ